MSVRKDGKIIAGTTVNPDLFDFKWADHILDDISWVRADTFSWQSGSFYTAMYNHLANDIQGKTSADLITETIGGVTIAYYLAADGHKIVEPDQEAAVVSIYNTVGVAWYYIVDVENTRFKLPRTKFGFTGMRDGVGKYVAPGAPNITGSWMSEYNISRDNGTDCSGAITGPYSTGTGHYGGSNATADWGYGFNFNASASNPIYGASNTIQPPATQMYLYFYAGNYTPDAVAQTAGLNAEMFNDLNAHKVIEFQEPTADNNYTWYRKYADGWVEQGGVGATSSGNGLDVVLLIGMSNTNYTLLVTSDTPTSTSASTVHGCHYDNKTTTGFRIICMGGNSGTWVAQNVNWQVSGMAAS